ncbi:DsrE family protein [Streptomyces sp. ADI98-10]|uniref:DsrE family protein n=1 Tax=Streptomyces sp. ADI98-10 TaxID=1522763 RepID=UPI000F55668B|nr:DsrE family protein [Streptomyces sp. ADI98-10]RPK88781.1 hypothetical protein EES46_16650 [Streptomyces sp. ADI98-10]
MDEYLLIESQGPWGGPGAGRFVADATRLRRAGHQVSVFLIENGTSAAFTGADEALRELLELGGQVWVDTFSMTHRSFGPDRLLPGARLVDMDEVAGKLLEPGVRGVWH